MLYQNPAFSVLAGPGRAFHQATILQTERPKKSATSTTQKLPPEVSFCLPEFHFFANHSSAWSHLQFPIPVFSFTPISRTISFGPLHFKLRLHSDWFVPGWIPYPSFSGVGIFPEDEAIFKPCPVIQILQRNIRLGQEQVMSFHATGNLARFFLRIFFKGNALLVNFVLQT